MSKEHLARIAVIRSSRETRAGAALAAERRASEIADRALQQAEEKLASQRAEQRQKEAGLYASTLNRAIDANELRITLSRIQSSQQRATLALREVEEAKGRLRQAQESVEAARLEYAARLRSRRKLEKTRQHLDLQAAADEIALEEFSAE